MNDALRPLGNNIINIALQGMLLCYKVCCYVTRYAIMLYCIQFLTQELTLISVYCTLYKGTKYYWETYDFECKLASSSIYEVVLVGEIKWILV